MIRREEDGSRHDNPSHVKPGSLNPWDLYQASAVVLAILHAAGPDGMPRSCLAARGNLTDNDVDKALEYLSSKAYLEAFENGVRLTPAGVAGYKQIVAGDACDGFPTMLIRAIWSNARGRRPFEKIDPVSVRVARRVLHFFDVGEQSLS